MLEVLNRGHLFWWQMLMLMLEVTAVVVVVVEWMLKVVYTRDYSS